MASTRSIEIKVGVLILTAVGLLSVFILIMGGINFQPTYSLYVDFDNPGGVQTGAQVKIAGVKVGKVEAIEFRGGKTDEKTGRREPLIRLKISIEKRYQSSVYENSLFYVTSQGILGEQFLAIEPGSSDRPPLPDKATVRGLDPPRLDMLLAESYELLHSTVSAVREHRSEIADAFDSMRSTLHGTSTFFANNSDKIDRIVTNVEEASVKGNDLLDGVDTKFVKNPQIDRILNNVDSVSQNVAANTPGLLDDAKVTMKNARKVSDTLGGDEQQAKIKRALDQTVTLLDKANLMANDGQVMVSHLRQGRGTVGALLMDEQLFDDLQEMVRDLKHNPWKFFWRE